MQTPSGSPAPARAILIGGTSHAGKSTLARCLTERLDGVVLSTDSLARHPGRPWPTPDRPVPPHVAEHYGGLDPDALLASVLAHYRRLGPAIVEIVARHLAAGQGAMVVEGSAVLPETAAQLRSPTVQTLTLAIGPALLRSRIERESGYVSLDEPGRALVDVFEQRTRLFGDWVRAEATRSNLPMLTVAADMDADAIADAVLATAE